MPNLEDLNINNGNLDMESIMSKVQERIQEKVGAPPGKDAENFCGGEGRPKARDEVKAFWKSLRERSSAAA